MGKTVGILGHAAGHEVRMPKPEQLVALKLHAASSPTRSKPEVDWSETDFCWKTSVKSFASVDWISPIGDFVRSFFVTVAKRPFVG